MQHIPHHNNHETQTIKDFPHFLLPITPVLIHHIETIGEPPNQALLSTKPSMTKGFRPNGHTFK